MLSLVTHGCRKSRMIQLSQVEKDLFKLNQQKADLHLKIANNYSPSQNINPEMEINRLYYFYYFQAKLSQVQTLSDEQQQLSNDLKDKLNKIRTELKMLELHLLRITKKHLAEEKKGEEKAIEEWVIQRREFA